MKRSNTPRRALAFTVIPGFLVLGITLFLLFPTYIPKAFYANWYFLAIAAILVCLPKSCKRLAPKGEENTHPHLPVKKWLGELLFIQVCLYIVFYGITMLFTHILPVGPSLPAHTFTRTLHNELLHYGLFPWAIIGLCVIAMGKASFCRQEQSFISATLHPIIRCNPLSTAGLIVNGTANLVTLIVFSTTLALCALLLAASIGKLIGIPIAIGFTVTSMLTVFLFLVIMITRGFRRALQQFFSNTHKLPLLLMVFVVGIGIALYFINWLFSGFANTHLPKPHTLTWFYQKGAEPFWLIFSLSWWFSWMPIISSHIARVSKGYSIRSILLGTLLLPVLLTLIVVLIHPVNLALPSGWNWLTTLLTLAALYGLLSRLTHHGAIGALIYSYLPKNGAPKFRHPKHFLRKCSIAIPVQLYLYIPAGVVLLAALNFLFIPYLFLNVLLIPLALLFS